MARERNADIKAMREHRLKLSTGRMEAFSDGVFAIAITLLVLDITIPSVRDHHLLNSVFNEWPTYLAYVVSFASIGVAWLSHNVITEYLDHADSILLRLNLMLLFFVSLLPFPTHMLSNYLTSTNSERIAVTIYGINLFLINAMLAIIWRYAMREKLVNQETDDLELRILTAKITPGLGFYVVVIAVGLMFPRTAVTLYLIIALFNFIPFRAIFGPRRQM